MDMQTDPTPPVRVVGAPRPSASPPPAGAPYNVRADWSRDYVAWCIAQTPQDGPLPSDVRPTHRFEIEFEACVVDPEAYERDIEAELRQFKAHQSRHDFSMFGGEHGPGKPVPWVKDNRNGSQSPRVSLWR